MKNRTDKKPTAGLLAGDVGGTKTTLAVFNSASGPRVPLVESTFPSGDYPSLEVLVRKFLSQTKTKVDRACFGVAGPVVDGQAKITNLPWMIHAATLAAALGLASVHLYNDLVTLAHAVPFLGEKDLHVLNTGRPASGGAIAVIAPGTGLGEAFLTRDATGYRACASEGGHADFAPSNAVEAGLMLYLMERFGHVSYERVCSGSGLVNIYDYLKDSGRAEETDRPAEQAASAQDRATVIVKEALNEERACSICQTALTLFISILGAEAGNLALKVMASGGVYLGGGILHRILPVLGKGTFMEAFTRKGRMSHLMEGFPVYVILNPGAALLGAARIGLSS
jgi:glucokinase